MICMVVYYYNKRMGELFYLKEVR